MSGAPGAVIALDIGGTKIASAIGDAGGELRGWRTLPTEADRGAEQVLCSAIALAKEVLAEERASGGDVCAVGVSTMGLTRVDHVDLAPNVPGWEDLAIPAAIEEAFPTLPARFGNDVKLAALAELTWGALAGVDCGIYVNLGTGIAATLVIDGRVVEGAHGAAGEVGYWLTDGSATPLMAADGAVPTEEALGGRGIARQSATLFGRPVEVAELVVLARHDPRAEALLNHLWDEIGTLIAQSGDRLRPGGRGPRWWLRTVRPLPPRWHRPSRGSRRALSAHGDARPLRGRRLTARGGGRGTTRSRRSRPPAPGVPGGHLAAENPSR